MQETTTPNWLVEQGFSTSFAARFWKKVTKTNGCWWWIPPKNKKGYGRMMGGFANGKTTIQVYAHRASWLLNVGQIPDGKWVLHHCDNPACVRPDHLFIGDAMANNQDMIAKGRANHPPRPYQRGENSPVARLTWEKVRQMRAMFANGAKIRAMARMFGCGRRTVGYVVRNETWKE